MQQKHAMKRKRMIHALITFSIICFFMLAIVPHRSANTSQQRPEHTLVINPTIDTTIDQTTPETNYNTSSTLTVSNSFGNNSSGWQRDILLYFDLSTLPSYTQITRSTLSVYYYDFDETDPAGRILSLHKITEPWDHQNVTWKSRPTTTQQNISSATLPTTAGWITWNVTSEVQFIISDPTQYLGWQLSDKNPWRTLNIPLIKLKSTETQTAYQPTLELCYTIPLQITTTGPYTAVINENISYNSTILTGGVPPYTWHWEFGDGSSSSDQNTTHAYTDAGTYTIRLTAYDNNGETTTVQSSATIKENTTEPFIAIQHPQNGLYIGNKKIASFQKPLILGPIDITIITETTYPIKKVKFFLDNQLQLIDTTAPYTWTWNTRTFPGKHVIKAIVVDETDASAVDQRSIWKIF